MAHDGPPRVGEGAVADLPVRSSRSWSSRPRTTGGSTRSPARSTAGVAAVAAIVRARLRPGRLGLGAAARPLPPRGRLAFPGVHALSAARTRAPSVGARVPDAGAQPAHRVAPHAERDLAHRARLCVVAAALVFNEYYFLGGIAFILGSVCDTLDGRYSRMSGKGTSFGAFLDSTLDRMEEGIVLTAVAFQFSAGGRRRGRGGRRRRGARLADGLLHPGARRGAGRGVQGRHRRPRRARRHPVGRPGAREGRRHLRRRAARAGRLAARRACR